MATNTSGDGNGGGNTTDPNRGGGGTRQRRYVLAGVVVGLGLITGAILLEVLGTILLAMTVAYVLLPVQGWLVRRGLSEWLSAAAATVIGFLGALAVFSPIVLTLYFRIDQLVAIVEELPQEIPIAVFGVTYPLEVAQVQTMAIDFLRSVAFAVASALPVLSIKLALFGMLLFAILIKGDAAGRAAVAPVPRAYRDVVYALARRARETLYAIYVLQVATSIATLVIAYPLFWGLGYEMALTLAIVAAILQFVPIIGPSLLIAAVTIYHVTAGDIVAAALVGVLGMLLIAWLPDIAVRPRLARRSAGLPGSLYFVGFTGGLFTLGAIGIVAGPLIVAVFVEAVDLLAAEVNSELSFTELAETDDSDPDSGDGKRDEPASLEGSEEPSSPVADD